MATKTLLAVQDFMPVFESMNGWCELVDGEVIEVSPGVFLHNRVRDTLLMILRTFVDLHKLGIVVSEQPFHLLGNTVRFPDIAFVRAGRELPPKGFPEGGPDLAIEVISPTNTLREMERKVSDYFAAGCTRVWIVYPEEREVYIHGITGVIRPTEQDLLQDSELPPGLSVKVAALFK